MNAILQLRPDGRDFPDLGLVFAAVEACPESLAVVDGGVVLYANPAWARTFGFINPTQFKGRAIEDFIPKHLFASRVAARKNEGGMLSAGELAYLQPDGRQVQLRVACGNFRSQGEDFQVLSARDIGKEEQSTTANGEGQRLESLGRLASGVAHDFNNLLTGIMLYCDLLIAELAADSPCGRHAREIRMAGEHGAKLVQQLLAVARPRAAEPGVVSLNDVIHGVGELLGRLIGENIVLATSLDSNLGAVRMAPVHIQQILLNLVLNARDAMPEGGHIMLATRNCAGYLPPGRETEHLQEQLRDKEKLLLAPCVELTITDTGRGMDSATLARARDPFFTTKKDGLGTGLGLATVSRLVMSEGGTMMVQSQPGRGTRVSLLLPEVKLDRTSAGKKAAAQIAGAGSVISERPKTGGCDAKATTPNHTQISDMPMRKQRGDKP